MVEKRCARWRAGTPHYAAQSKRRTANPSEKKTPQRAVSSLMGVPVGTSCGRRANHRRRQEALHLSHRLPSWKLIRYAVLQRIGR